MFAVAHDAYRWDSLGYYEPPRKREKLNFKVPAEDRESLELLKRAWKLKAELDGLDPSDIDLTYVCATLLHAALEKAWDEILKDTPGTATLPRSDDDWEIIERAIRRDVKNHRK